MRQLCSVFDLTKSKASDYLTVWKYQRALVEHIHRSKTGPSPFPDSLILVQHPSVYTLGKGATLNNLKFDAKSPCADRSVYRVSRGGEVTWHGPGQLVAYPIMDLTRHKKDLRWYVNKLEDVVISTLNVYGIKSSRSPINPGVWVGNNKICAIGITASRWITMHGIALNITCDLSQYSYIVPCGISPDVGGVCSMDQYLDSPASMNSVSKTLLECYSDEFQVDLAHGSVKHLDNLLDSYVDIRNETLPRV